MPNNFAQTLPDTKQALKAVCSFKDEYLLDFINVEELDEQEEDLDEKIVEKAIVANVKKFIMTFGQDFSFIGNQYRMEVAGEEMFIDLLFFNRELNSLVAVELKSGKFRTSYLGQLNTYLSALDTYIRKPHENPSIGIILCREMNQTFVEFAVRDYNKPMGVATYRASKDMPERLRNALPDVEDLKKAIVRQKPCFFLAGNCLLLPLHMKSTTKRISSFFVAILLPIVSDRWDSSLIIRLICYLVYNMWQNIINSWQLWKKRKKEME